MLLYEPLCVRAHRPNRALALEPDFYKFTMGRLIWRKYPDVQTTFAFTNRTASARAGEVVDLGELREQLDKRAVGYREREAVAVRIDAERQEGEMIMNPKRILVALSLTDGDAAFERGLALAASSGADLLVLHAVPAGQRFAYRADERLQRATGLRKRAEAAGVTAETVEQHGDPAEIIVLHADARSVDLIVMSTGRRTGWARLRERSVAERVLRRTLRPTLVIGDDDMNGEPFANLLVAVDLSPVSTALIGAALELSGGGARQLTVVHAVDRREAAEAGGAAALLQGMMPPGIDRDMKVDLRVNTGNAAEIIKAQAADVGADLVVLGRSRRFMHLGSTAVRILRSTDRALLIVPPGAAAETLAA
jgi:nucleotide-binding universal stress UspA family protein